MPAGRGGTPHPCGSERGRSSRSAWPAACCWRRAEAMTTTGDGASGRTSEEVTLNIVGFAVPEAANVAIAEEFNKTDEGANVSFKSSYGASGDQSRAVAEGLAGRLRALLRGQRRHPPGGRGPRGRHLGRRPHQGDRVQLDRGVRGPRGQPQGHPGLGRPDQARRGDRHPQPGLVRSGPVERAWRRTARSSRAAAPRRRRPSTSPTSSPTSSRCPAAAVTPPPPSSAAPATC